MSVPAAPFETVKRNAEQIAPTYIRRFEIPTCWTAERRSRLTAELSRAIAAQQVLARRCVSVLPAAAPTAEGPLLCSWHPPAAAEVRLRNRRTAAFDANDLCWLARGALRGLAAAAAVHGGIHAGALLLDPLGRVLLSDFGVHGAYLRASGTALPMLHYEGPDRCEEGVASGTYRLLPDTTRWSTGWLATMRAPEQLLDGGGLSAPSDLFALGVTLFVLACGRHPYGIALDEPDFAFHPMLDPYDLVDCIDHPDASGHDSGEIDRLAGVANFLRHLLASDPDDRFTSAAAALTALEEQFGAVWKEIDSLQLATAQAVNANDRATAQDAITRLLAVSALPLCVRRRAALQQVQLNATANPRCSFRLPTVDELQDGTADEPWERVFPEGPSRDSVVAHQEQTTRGGSLGTTDRRSASRVLVGAAGHQPQRSIHAFAAARKAWRSGDPNALEQHLNNLPEVPPASVARWRRGLRRRLNDLRRETGTTRNLTADTAACAACLVLELTGYGMRLTHDLPGEGDSLVIGRGGRATIRLDNDPWVSREHLRLGLHEGRLWARDVGSRHGTRLNGRSLEKVTELQVGDELQIGASVLRIEPAACPVHP